MDEKSVLELLCQHLGTGGMDAGANANLAALVKRAEQSEFLGGTFWRVVNVPASVWENLKSGRSAILEPRQYSCWSRERLGVTDLLRNRGLRAETDGFTTLLLRRDVPQEDVALDVEILAKSLGLPEMGGVSWFQYASREREVIVRNPHDTVRIDPGDVFGAWGVGASDLAAVFDPVPGETVFDADEGADQIIASCYDTCPITGCCVVATTTGKRLRVIWEPWSGWTYGADPEMGFGPG